MPTQALMEPGDGFNWFSKHQAPQREEQPLTRTAVEADVCDARCPAPAVFRADKEGEASLLFCGHHYDANEPALLAKGWVPSQLHPRPS